MNNPALGTVAASPASASGYFKLGTTVTLTATPKTGHRFSDFVLNGTRVSSNPLVLQVAAPINVVAEFH